jgi:hypothetical protein
MFCAGLASERFKPFLNTISRNLLEATPMFILKDPYVPAWIVVTKTPAECRVAMGIIKEGKVFSRLILENFWVIYMGEPVGAEAFPRNTSANTGSPLASHCVLCFYARVGKPRAV